MPTSSSRPSVRNCPHCLCGWTVEEIVPPGKPYWQMETRRVPCEHCNGTGEIRETDDDQTADDNHDRLRHSC